jgi:hypothetical protein
MLAKAARAALAVIEATASANLWQNLA